MTRNTSILAKEAGVAANVGECFKYILNIHKRVELAIKLSLIKWSAQCNSYFLSGVCPIKRKTKTS